VFIDPASSYASGVRVVLVELVSEAAALSDSGQGRVRIAVYNLPAVAQRTKDLLDGTDLQFEILRLRTRSETCADVLVSECRRICGEGLPCRLVRRLDKHDLDVALSAGRHAAERAKLAGVERLIAMAPSVCLAGERPPPTTGLDARCRAVQLPCFDRCCPKVSACFDPYDALCCLGGPEIAALAGIAIAAAQMGIPFCLPGSAGSFAAEAAVGLNPGVRAWLDPISTDLRGSAPSPVCPLDLCAVRDRSTSRCGSLHRLDDGGDSRLARDLAARRSPIRNGR
jgi:nicotinate-nucleotide--dimethylbenzimidazole phosphoribosyltransferase